MGSVSAASNVIFKGCIGEIDTSNTTSDVILNFQGVHSIDPDGVRAIAQLQLSLRSHYRIYLCCLSSDVTRLLNEFGILRNEEVFPDLLKAIQAIMNLTLERK